MTLVLTGYTLRPDRCVIEVTARVFGFPLARGRFQAVDGALAGDSLTVTVDARSLRIPVIGRALKGHKGLSVRKFPTIVYADGRAKVRQTECALPLDRKLITVDEDTVILWARGRIGRCQPRTRRLNLPAKLLGRRRLHVEIAAEFTSGFAR